MPRRLVLPVGADEIGDLHVGDEVLVSGRIVTGREAAHRRLLAEDDAGLRTLVEGRFLYHCGPVVVRDAATGAWRVVAAGPSTSMREEPWEADVIARSGLRGVIGKGGMGERTRAALRAHGAVYLHAGGALAVTLARTVVAVRGVRWLDELGVTEALWELEVQDFPAVVTMDAHGETLHERADAGAAGGADDDR